MTMIVTNDLCAVKFSVVPTSNELGPYQITGSDCTVNTNLANLYYVNQSGLIIRNSTATDDKQPISTSGLYIADCGSNDNNGNRSGAKLVVVRK